MRKPLSAARGQRLFDFELNLDFTVSTPLPALVVSGVVQSIDQQPPQPVAAFQIGADNLKSHFVYAGPAQKNMGADLVAHPNGNFEISLAANAEVVFLRAHAAAQAQFANLNS